MPFKPAPVSLTQLVHDRKARFRQQLESSEYDAIIVSSPESVLYATGYESMPARLKKAYYYAAIITAERCAMVVPSADFAPAIDAGVAPDDITPFGTFFFSGESAANTLNVRHKDFDGALREALTKVKGRRVLVEWNGIPPHRP
ncbi:aminopeptidase P family N-terminal domain-containing protein [Acerihabitans sp. KWT182]|uniref:Aminopeptidase P family N-terminal domain-containing protein n=1 Tax=Acerihabitans sp. KWT182 TaxID=3157919 RepID=A0AAU7Q7D9_9GAMM